MPILSFQLVLRTMHAEKCYRLQKEWSLFYEMSLSCILFDGYEESKLVTFHTGRKHEKFSSLLVLFH